MIRNIGIAVCISLIAFLSMYIESKLFDKEYKKSNYVKVILLCNLITFGTIYVLTTLSSTNSLPVIQESNILGQRKFLPDIGENILVNS